jgi:hypothetical protein
MTAQTRQIMPPALKTLTMPAPSGLLQRACACGGTPGPTGECAACRKKRLGALQRSATAAAPVTVPPVVKDVLNSPGQPLDPATRTFMEPRLGHDFGQVCVHTNSQAARSAQSVNALAYTVGRHIAFDAGQYRPDTPSGRRMVAHELVHVMQQSRHGQATGHDLRIAGNDAAEHEAERMGAAVDSGVKAVSAESRSGPVLQRQPKVPVPARVIPDPCIKLGNCPPPPPVSPIANCSPMLHRTVMLTMAREYVRSQLDPSLSLNVRSIDCFFGIGPCKIEFDSGVAVDTSLLLNPFATPGTAADIIVVEEAVPPSSPPTLKDLIRKRFGPRCSYTVGCVQPGQLTWTLTRCHQTGPFNPDDSPKPSGDERIA